MKIQISLALMAAVMLSGCAFHAQKANLAPTTNVAKTDEGHGIPVGLRVVDERPTKSLGHRGAGFGKAAEITSNQDVAALLQNQIADGLKNKGFNVVPYLDSKTKLTVEIRSLEYSTSTGFWTGGVNVSGAIKAVGAKPGDAYEKMYRTDKERRVVVVPTAGKNEEDINSGLSDLLQQFFDDVGLFRFLAAVPAESE